ncbi:VPS28 protein-domain-containing protein [Baffinella frigidus]|nr:VPS28 protein-domain-containing protein [Cryptophyta sp. CCMP2293]
MQPGRRPPPSYGAANRPPVQREPAQQYQGPGTVANNLGGHYLAAGGDGGGGAERKKVSEAGETARRELEKPVQVIDRHNRQEIEQYADYYALIRTMEKLEAGYIRGTFRDKEYEVECRKLLPRFTTLKESLPAEMRDPATAIPTFMSRYGLKTLRAANRFSVGVPATAACGAGDESKPSALHVAEAVESFITLADSLRLNMTAVDQLHPLTAELVNRLGKIVQMAQDFEARIKMKSWLSILSSMRATEVLTEDQARQFVFDIDNAHQAFLQFLHGLS